jgi:hypothetical protein
MKIIAPTAHAQSSIACTRLLLSIGKCDDRAAYGGGFEDFLEGKAKCIAVEGAALSAPQIVSSREQIENQDMLSVLAIEGRDGKIAASATARAG